MACGDAHVVVTDVRYSDNPHVDPEVTVVAVRPLDDASRAWVADLPRVTRWGGAFVAGSARAADAAALDALESAAPREGDVVDRLRAAGLPREPAPPNALLANHAAVVAATTIDASTPIRRVLELTRSDIFLVRRMAEEHIAKRRGVASEIASALDAVPSNSIAMMASVVKGATPAELDALAVTLAARLAPLVSRADAEESAIGSIVDMLSMLGPAAKRAEGSLRALEKTGLASRRSMLRDAIARALQKQ